MSAARPAGAPQRPSPMKAGSLPCVEIERRLGQMLAIARDHLGISSIRAAEITGLTRHALARIETGESRLLAGTMVVLTAHMGLDVDALIEAATDPDWQESPAPSRRWWLQP